MESDKTSIEKQNALIRELELPVACLVHSGKKSLHAIVKIEASSYEEYRKRVDYLYKVCRRNGLEVDTQNKKSVQAFADAGRYAGRKEAVPGRHRHWGKILG